MHEDDLDFDEEDDWDEWDDDGIDDNEEDQLVVPNNAQVALITVIYYPADGKPWTVEDGRKALDNRFSCGAKSEVLNKLAAVLDDMCNPPAKLDHDSEPVEITVAVTMQASLCDLDTQVNVSDLQRSASQAVENAIRHSEQVGFNHALSEIVSLKTVQVRTLSAE
jgi:hypothetical protein